jgi:hypothetical protein
MSLMAMEDSYCEDEDKPKKPSLSLPLATPRLGYALSLPAPAILSAGRSPPTSPATSGPHPLTASRSPHSRAHRRARASAAPPSRAA